MRLFGVILSVFCTFYVGKSQPLKEVSIFMQNMHCIAYNEIYDISTDQHGYIYLATDKGTFYYNGENQQALDPKKQLVDYIGIYKNTQEEFFFLPFSGCIQKIIGDGNIQKKSIKIYGENQKFRIVAAFTDSQDTLHFLQYKSNPPFLEIKLYHEEIVAIDTLKSTANFFYGFIKNKKINLDEHKDEKFINELSVSSKQMNINIVEDKYLITKRKIYQCENNKIVLLIDIEKYNLDGIVRKLTINRSNNKIYFSLFGKDCGVYEYHAGNIVKIFNEESATGLCVDINNQLWVSTRFRGLFKIKLWDLNGSILDLNCNISKVIAINEDQLYYCDNIGNLYFCNRKKNRRELVISTRNKLAIAPALRLENNIVVFSNYDDTYLINSKTNRIEKKYHKVDANYKIVDYYEIGRHNILVSNYFCEYSNATTKKKKNIEFVDKVYSAFQLNKDSVYLGSISGLYLLETKNGCVSKIELPKKFNYQKVGNITKCNDEIIFYFDDGILIQNSGTKYCNELPMLIDGVNEIKAILKHKEFTVLVLRTEIVIYNKENQLIGKYGKGIKNLTDCYIGGYIINNQLCVYDSERIYSYKIDDLKNYHTNLAIYISNIESNKNKLEITSNNSFIIQLNVEASFSINLNIFNKYQNDKLVYKFYSNSNRKAHACELLNNSISFNSINPGNYIIEIISENVPIKYIYFIVLPLWHQTLIFKIIIVVLFSLSLLFLSYLYYSKILSDKKKHLMAKHKILELEIRAKLNQLKPHFVFNALIPLQSYILTQNVKEGLHYLDKFSILLRKMLKISNFNETTIENELEFLNLYIQLRREESSNSFDYKIICDLNKNTIIPKLMIQPLVENAINYGMKNFENKEYLEISIQEFDSQTIMVKIFDSGNGIKDFQNTIGKKNHSLDIIRERLLLSSNLLNNENLGIDFLQIEKGFLVIIYLPILTYLNEN